MVSVHAIEGLKKLVKHQDGTLESLQTVLQNIPGTNDFVISG